jgi:hypothetical protein
MPSIVWLIAMTMLKESLEQESKGAVIRRVPGRTEAVQDKHHEISHTRR